MDVERAQVTSDASARSSCGQQASDGLDLQTEALVSAVCRVVEIEIRQHHSQLICEPAVQNGLANEWNMNGGARCSGSTTCEVGNTATRCEASWTSTAFQDDTMQSKTILKTPSLLSVPAAKIAKHVDLHRQSDASMVLSAPEGHRISRVSVGSRISGISTVNQSIMSMIREIKSNAHRDDSLRSKALNVKTKSNPQQSVAGVDAMEFCVVSNSASLGTVSSMVPFVAHPRNLLGRIVNSSRFDYLIALVILANVLWLGVDADTMAHAKDTSHSAFGTILNCAFFVIFLVELLFRIAANPRTFFTGKEMRWNLFDTSLVLVSVLPSLVELLLGGNSLNRHLRVMPALRALRVLRIVRIVRTVRKLRPLSQLLAGILGTISSCCWALIMLAMIMYIFGITFNHAVVHYLYSDCAAWYAAGRDQMEVSNRHCPTKPNPEIYRYFGTLPRTFQTLFEAICGGIDWGDATQALADMGDSGKVYKAVFFLYISFVYLGILNVLTALFCQNAVENALGDQEFLLEGKMSAMKAIENKLMLIFKDLDNINQGPDSPEGMFTFDELEEFMSDNRIKAQFAILGIVPEDAWTLFKLLDREEKGIVGIEAFISGCMRLRGEATRMDVHLLSDENRFLSDKLDRFMRHVLHDLDAMKRNTMPQLCTSDKTSGHAAKHVAPTVPPSSTSFKFKL